MKDRRTAWRRLCRNGGIVFAALWLTAQSCGPRLAELDSRLGAAFLTYTRNDTYALTGEGEADVDLVVTTSAPSTNEGDGTRVAFWMQASSPSADQETCATWSNNTDPLRQPGAALRIRTADGRTRAITVTQNVYYYALWGFNIHVMDSGAEQKFTHVAGFNLYDTFMRDGELLPYPWRLCARVVGDVVSFKVWPLIDPEPTWDDPRYGGSVQLPVGWSEPGIPGWYIGHLTAGHSMQFSDMTTSVVGASSVEPTTPPRAPGNRAAAP